MDIEELLLSSATSLAKLIRSKKVSSKELVQAAIHKVKQENSQLNAVIHLREEKALQEADNLTDTGQPFLGVPILIKGLGQTLKVSQIQMATFFSKTILPNKLITS